MKKLVGIWLILLSNTAFGQNPDANLYMNITVDNKPLTLDVGPKWYIKHRCNRPDTIFAQNHKFKIIIIGYPGRFDLSAYDGFSDYWKPFTFSYLEQGLGWRGDSKVIIIDSAQNDTAEVSLKNITRPSFVMINFKKGKYILDWNSPADNPDPDIFICNQHHSGMAKQRVLKGYFPPDLLRGRYTIDLKRFTKTIGNKHFMELDFIDKSDTAFVKLHPNGDMGVRYETTYDLKGNLTNGYYAVYVNDTLKLSATYLDRKRNGIYSVKYPFYYTDIPYKNGVPDGVGKTVYNTGELKNRSIFSENKYFIRTSYNKQSQVETNEFYVNEVLVRWEVFKDGKLLSVTERNGKDKSLPTTVINGMKIYTYKEGVFNVTYENNAITAVIWTPKQ